MGSRLRIPSFDGPIPSELHLKLRNEKIFSRPLSAPQAAAVCQAYRKNQAWMLIESAPVMESVWDQAAQKGLAFRRIIDCDWLKP